MKRTALISGARGFIGRQVTAALDKAGYGTVGIDIADGTDARWFFQHDTSCFDLVVHCAAVVGGRRVVTGSPLDHAQNLEIDAALFTWARRTQPGRVIYFSSSCAYPVNLALWKKYLHEDDITWPPHPGMMPDELYGWTKLTGEFLAATAAESR